MFTVEKIENVPNPAIPQWRVYDQERALTLSVRILKSNNRSWLLYAERWVNGQWTLIERLGETSSQALAYCDAGDAESYFQTEHLIGVPRDGTGSAPGRGRWICAKEQPMESQTIELGAATLAALQALVPPAGMTPLAWVALGVGLGQLVLLTVGLVLMYRSNTSREQQTRAQAQAEAQRHAETLRALDQQHAATLRAFEQQATASREQHVETLEALRQQGDALRTLIERTAPAQA